MRTSYIIYFLLFLFVPFFAVAHGGGLALEQEDGAYRLSLESVTQEVRSGAPERLNFEIASKEGTDFVAFTHIWVRISGPEDEFHFSGEVKAAPLGMVTGFSYRFPSEGEYEIATRFYENERVLAEGSFMLKIVPERGGAGTKWIVLISVLVAGIVVGIFIRRRVVRETRA